MPGDPKECRKHARNCLQLAEASANAEITRTFVDLAHSWTKLALALESAQALLVAVADMENAGFTPPPGAFEKPHLRAPSDSSDQHMVNYHQVLAETDRLCWVDIINPEGVEETACGGGITAAEAVAVAWINTCVCAWWLHPDFSDADDAKARE